MSGHNSRVAATVVYFTFDLYSTDMTESLEERITTIEQRNHRVELDKAWEVSKTRLVSVAVLTYICATLVLFVLHVERPWLSAFIPTLGFILSVQSLPILKRQWIQHQLNRHHSSADKIISVLPISSLWFTQWIASFIQTSIQSPQRVH